MKVTRLALSAALRLCWIVAGTAIAFFGLLPSAHAQAVASATPPPNAKAGEPAPAPGCSERRGIAVVGVGEAELNEEGGLKGVRLGSNAGILGKAESAISESHGWRLVGRDQWPQQVKEINLEQDGFVNTQTAKTFGQAARVDYLLSVFISNITTPHVKPTQVTQMEFYVPQILSGKLKIPEHPDPIWLATHLDLARIYYELFRNPSKKIQVAEASVTIIVRSTKVETGDRVTKTIKGVSYHELSGGNAEEMIQEAMEDAFKQCKEYAWETRCLLDAKILSFNEKFLRMDLGQKNALAEKTIFEIFEVTYEVSDDGKKYRDAKKVCDASVVNVNEDNAKIETGEAKDKIVWGQKVGTDFKTKTEFAKTIKKGNEEKKTYEVREKK